MIYARIVLLCILMPLAMLVLTYILVMALGACIIAIPILVWDRYAQVHIGDDDPHIWGN